MEKKKRKPGVMLYWDTFDILARLTPDQTVRILQCIQAFAQEGREPEDLDQDPILDLAWACIRPKLAADDDRYWQIRQKNQINGLIRSFKCVYAPAHGLDPGDKQALEAFLRQRLGEEAPATADGRRRDQPDPDTEINSDPFSLTEPEAGTCGDLPGFQPPTVSEVRAFCQENRLQMNPAGFWDHENRLGWKQSQGKDWKAAARIWAAGGPF